MRYESCMIDACSSEDDIDLGICANAKELASRCHELVDNELFDSGNWRSPDFCRKWCFMLFLRDYSMLISDTINFLLFVNLHLIFGLWTCCP